MPRGLAALRLSKPGNYDAELKGDAAWVYAHDLAGKIRKTKYRAVGGWE